jgi:alkyl sulfatase BDS1-like metallo-beta-lactamase superfamily hydrolase
MTAEQQGKQRGGGPGKGQGEEQPLNALIVREGLRAGAEQQEAEPLGDGIHRSRGISNSYLVTTPEGDVLVNTGMHFEAEAIAARYARVSTGPRRVIVFTQGHGDHVGGWSRLVQTGTTETIAQADHPRVREYWTSLHAYYVRRSGRLWSGDVRRTDRDHRPPEPELSTTFLDSHRFALGGREFELFAVPGGETTDSLVLWLPEQRTVFTGNLTGPLLGHLPNLYTVRGDKIRSAARFAESVDRVLSLRPETLITGHGEPLRGGRRIREVLGRVRDATLSIREQTLAGMNAGTDLFTLMRTVALPPSLEVPQGHGKVPWLVRAIWEEHSGWFRYESSTELYAVPPSAVWPDLVELAGGTGPLTHRAEAHLAGGRPLEALHLLEPALAAEPRDREALRAKRAALRLLLDRSGRENFSEVRWLEAELRDTESELR